MPREEIERLRTDDNVSIIDSILAKIGSMEEMGGASSARVAELEAANQALEAEIQTQKARNYDLLMSQGEKTDDGVEYEDSGDTDPDPLFKDEEGK